MRSLEEILAELNAAEKEYAQKCARYGIEENGKKKKGTENAKNEGK
ncbi:MAG: hypothetical protein IJI46_00340 [Erysipelotrichaceae bacterium]|nr:hypothetical protein [Erysipelotrichaceae bacterium]